MTPDFILEALPTITPMGALLAVGVWIIRTIAAGKWVPVVLHERVVTNLQAAAEVANRRAERAEQQVDKLTDTLDTHTHLLTSIRDAAGRPPA